MGVGQGQRTDAEMRNQQSMRSKVTLDVNGMRRPTVKKKGRVMAGDAHRARQRREHEMKIISTFAKVTFR